MAIELELESEIRTPPLLEPGDRLDRAEFERRYDAMPDLKKAELIEGIVYMSSPVRYEKHSRPCGLVALFLGNYYAATPGVGFAPDASVRLDGRSMPQPDFSLFVETSRGGRAWVGPDDYLEGAPELVAEVSSNTVSIDLNAKFVLYERFGVREYLVWRVEDAAVDWFVLKDGAYERLAMDEEGIYRSVVFPGLWLDAKALVGGEVARVRAVLGEGLASAEHAAFKASPG